jgi:hypothetical protein
VTYEAELKLIEDKLLSTDPQDVETIELLKDEHARVRKVAAAAVPRAAAPAGAAGAPDRGGSTATGAGIPSARTAAAVAATAPAKGLAGIADLVYTGGRWINRAANKDLQQPEAEPNLSPQVGRLTDELAGQPVGRSVGRSAFEGAIMAPLGGGAVGPGVAAGAAGGAASEWAAENDLPWWTQLVAGVGAGGAAGGAANLTRMRLAEALSKGRLVDATRGITPSELRAGQGVLEAGAEHGVRLMPGQAFEDPSGITALQSALMQSKAGGADSFASMARRVPERTRALVETMRNWGRQTPRPDDQMAADIQKMAEVAKKAEGNAVNAATKPLYEAIDSQKPLSKFYTDYRAKQVATILDEAMLAYRSDPETSLTALSKAKERMLALLQDPRKPVTPEELHNALRNVRDKLPEYTNLDGSVNNLARKRVSDTLQYLQDIADNLSPSMAQARQVQGELRSNLSGKFSPLERIARKSGGPGPFLNQVASEPEVLGLVAGQDSRLAQELGQRQVNQGVTKALESMNPGETAWREVGRGADVMEQVPGQEGSIARLRQALEVARAGGRPTGSPNQLGSAINPAQIQSKSREVARSIQGQVGNALGVLGRLVGNTGLRFSDEAAIRVLSRPDALERLAYLKSLPPTQVTRAALIASFPELFKEQK